MSWNKKRGLIHLNFGEFIGGFGVVESFEFVVESRMVPCVRWAFLLRNLRLLRATPRQMSPATRWAVIVLSSPATLTGSEEKKTGPSRFIADFSGGWVDENYANRRKLKPAFGRTSLPLQPAYGSLGRFGNRNTLVEVASVIVVQ
jgi:hypothetical protein